MRARLLPGLAVLLVSSCSDLDTPTEPLRTAPSVRASHLDEIVPGPTGDDLCGGLSPCDAYDYDRDADGGPDGVVGLPGFCFLPPMVENHLSDPACSDPFVPELDGLFKLAWCQVDYGGGNGSTPPSVLRCQPSSEWQSLVRDGGGAEFYSASVKWSRSEADDGDVFRLYVVHGDIHFAHRDVVIDPNLTTPADGYVHAIGYGTEPVKVRITTDFSCVRYDTQEPGSDNAATCLVDGASNFSFETDRISTTFDFPEGNPVFLADFEVSECLSLGFAFDETGGAVGNALVDVPLADCRISLSSEELERLTVPARIEVTLTDPRWSDVPGEEGPFGPARFNILQWDEFGVGVLPPSVDPGWFGLAGSDVAFLRWLGRGMENLASVFAPRPLHAAMTGAGWDFTRMSDFQVAVMPVAYPAMPGVECATPAPHCSSLGTVGGGVVPVSVQVSAPSSGGPVTTDPTEDPSNHLDVPDTRLHFFPENGTVSCPLGSGADAFGRGCYEAGAPDLSTDPASFWDHLVVVTGPDGTGTADWSLEEGSNRLNVSACGVARPGDSEASPPGEPGSDRVWGSLGTCSDRRAALAAMGFDNGPADGFTPFEAVDTESEVAIYGLPLVFEARTCPRISIDGRKGDAFGAAEWEECAAKTAFSAPLSGPKGAENAWLYTYNDDQALYLALEVATGDLGNKFFVHLVEAFAGGDGVSQAGDELLVDDFGDPAVPVDWHYTQACVDNNSSSLCGEIDAKIDGAAYSAEAAAQIDGAGTDRVFYELRRPFDSPNSVRAGKEDLGAGPGDRVGLKLQVTQGQGGGKGGFAYPDPQTSPIEFHPFVLE